jgi:protein tyrosine phosphatase (PTP) superfamily phosphohydrolase (DUF442 family)
MAGYTLPSDFVFNRGPIRDPQGYVRDAGCASWLYLCGSEFAEMEGGMSYAQVESAVDRSANVISDPPRTMDLDLARRHVAALDDLPRPTLVSCRTGPRASATVYMYAGLKAGASPEDVVAAAERDGAPCATFDDLKTWISSSMQALSAEAGGEAGS